MTYQKIEYDRKKFIRCDRCGVLKRRSYKPPLEEEEKKVILTLKEGGLGSRAIATRTGVDRQTVKRVLKKYPNAK